MRNIETREARIGGQWLRSMLIGPQGSGKTWTALQIAEHLDDGRGTLFIDTEKTGPDLWSSELYADRFRFNVDGWEPPYNPVELADHILERGRSFSTIILDSGSHFWQSEGGTLPQRDKIADERFKGNQWAAWSQVRPVQESFVRAIGHAPCHLIVCTRAKVAWDTSGRAPVAVGTEAKQDPELEHEFTWTAALTQPGHELLIRKSRAPMMDAGDVFAPGEEQDTLWQDLAAWVKRMDPPAPVILPSEAAMLRAAMELLDGPERMRVKQGFMDRFQVPPNRLGSDRLREAQAWVAAGGRDLEVPGEDPESGEIAEPEPAAKKATRKRAAGKPRSVAEVQAKGDAKALVEHLLGLPPEESEVARARLESEGIEVDGRLTGAKLAEAWELMGAPR